MRVLALAVAVLAMGASSAIVATPSTIDEPTSGSLTITVAGLKSDKGKVRVAVFGAGEQWLKKAAFAKVLDIENRRCQWLIEAVPHGEYGIAVFHDENGNGKNDRNFMGIPKEPYGFSNKARRTFGPPKWEEARFPVTSVAAEVVVEVK